MLDERERYILTLRFGLDRGEPRTPDEVGQLVNLSRERVRQIEARAPRPPPPPLGGDGCPRAARRLAVDPKRVLQVAGASREIGVLVAEGAVVVVVSSERSAALLCLIDWLRAFAQHRLDEPFRFPIGLGPVGPGAEMLDPQAARSRRRGYLDR